MIENKLIKQVETYLSNSKINYVKKSIEYTGIRENYQFEEDNPPSDYYLLSYSVVHDIMDKYSTHTYFVYINKDKEKIKYMIGPQTSEIID